MKRITPPKDVVAMCEQIVRGYDRRKKEYERSRVDIVYRRASGGMTDFIAERNASNISDPTERKAEQLERLEDSLDVKFMRAVEQSLLMLGTDVSRDSRERLCKAVLLNCENGREYPYEMLNIDEFSRRDFYRRKKRFIMGVGVVLGVIDGSS